MYAYRQRDHLSTELESEKSHTQELQQNLYNLQYSLDTIIASQLETSNEAKRRFNDALQQLAAEREERLYYDKVLRDSKGNLREPNRNVMSPMESEMKNVLVQTS